MTFYFIPFILHLRIVVPTIASLLRLKPTPFLNWFQTPESINITAVSAWLTLPEPMLSYFCFLLYYLPKWCFVRPSFLVHGFPTFGSFFHNEIQFQIRKNPGRAPISELPMCKQSKTFLTLCVLKKIPMEHSVVFLAFWLAHLFVFDTWIDWYPKANP